jgi:hypothetical protein
LLPQPLALQALPPEPAKAGEAENVPTASMPARATVASFLFTLALCASFLTVLVISFFLLK